MCEKLWRSGKSLEANLSRNPSAMQTRDNVFVTVMVSVQYQVKRVLLYEDGPPPAAFYKLTNSHQQISSYVFDVVRSTVPKMDLDDVFTVSWLHTLQPAVLRCAGMCQSSPLHCRLRPAGEACHCSLDQGGACHLSVKCWG